MLGYFTKFRTRPRPAPTGDSIVLSPDARVSLEPNGAAFLHTRSGIVFTSNRIGARIWQGLLERKSVDAIAAGISRENGARPEQVRQDTADFVRALETHGFLSRTVGC